MMKKIKNRELPDLTEFTDEEGRKWIQTSPEDLFSNDEFVDIIESIDKEKETGDIILARIDFQRVNKEYHDKAVELQTKLKKQNELLKKLLLNSKETIDRKNIKLKELIDYIKKLHMLLAYYKLKPDDFNKIESISEILSESQKIMEEVEEKKIDYVQIEEFVLNDNGEEGEPANF
ncbi:MAG: hypothetical protein SVZ03_10045 [Spirochaetota bacterium]|nr:hypothetical protein [Spirochaetota bacterium]